MTRTEELIKEYGDKLEDRRSELKTRRLIENVLKSRQGVAELDGRAGPLAWAKHELEAVRRLITADLRQIESYELTVEALTKTQNEEETDVDGKTIPRQG
jgi:uncharacterized protein involved in exopolysaccharide biosynthesis